MKTRGDTSLLGLLQHGICLDFQRLSERRQTPAPVQTEKPVWLPGNKPSRLLTLQLIMSVTRALALWPALDRTSTYTFVTPEQDLSSFSSRTFKHEQTGALAGKRKENPNLNECSSRYLPHKACCSSDEHIFACIVFWDGGHDVCRPLQRVGRRLHREQQQQQATDDAGLIVPLLSNTVGAKTPLSHRQ